MSASGPSLILLFEGDFVALGEQLTLLSARPQQEQNLGESRLQLFQLVLGGHASLVALDSLYGKFLSVLDYEAAAACTGLSIVTCMNEGRALGRLETWYPRISGLLDRKNLSLAGHAFLLLHKALVEVYARGDLQQADATFLKQRRAAEQAASAALQILGATWYSYCFTWSGDLARAEILLRDAASLLRPDAIAPPVLCQFQIARAMICTLYGRISEGLALLEGVTGHPVFCCLPPAMQLLALGHLLDARIIAGDLAAVEIIADQVRALAIPADNDFHRCYLHFTLGMAALRQERPHKALRHCEEAELRAKQSQSPVPIRMNALLRGLCLQDLGRHQEAMEHLNGWLERWQACSFHLIAALGYLEISAICAANGNFDQARQTWHKAHACLPAEEKMPHLYRPQSFYDRLAARLFPQEKGQLPIIDEYPVQITTLGGFCLKIGQRQIYDRDWHGSQSRNLLFALIVYGGRQVAKGQLADLLWPDSDGDLAANSLEVTLTRLRRVGCETGEKPLPWLVVKNRRVSLANGLCRVDALEFHAGMNRKSGQSGTATGSRWPTALLDTYTGPFLPGVTGLPWLDSFRNELEQLYVRGVLRCREALLADQQPHAAVRLLEQASHHAPASEEIWASRMQICLDAGEKGLALQLYRQAETALEAELGLKPGARLTALSRLARQNSKFPR